MLVKINHDQQLNSRPDFNLDYLQIQLKGNFSVKLKLTSDCKFKMYKTNFKSIALMCHGKI